MKYQKAAISGAKWTTLSTIVLTLLQFGQVTVLARILTPTEFGLVGMVTILINLFNIFSDLGVSNAIIYKQEDDRKKLSSLYWLNIFFGILLCIILILSKNVIIAYYNEPRLERIITLSSIIFLINPIGQQFQFLFQKEFQFETIGKIEILAGILGTITAIYLALNDFKEFSMIYGLIVTATVKSLSLFVLGCKRWRPLLYFKLSDIKEHLKFGLYTVGDNFLNFFSTNLGNIIIGGALGAKALGFYTLAYQLVIFPISKLNPIITKVAFPVFSKIGGDKVNLKSGYLNVMDIISSINFPLLVGLLVTSDSIIPIVYGSGWEVTIQLVKLLCIVGILRSLGNPLGSLLMSQGRADLGFKLNLITLLLQLPVLYIGAKVFGIYGVATGFITVQFINIILNFRMVSLIIGSWINDLFQRVYMQLIISAVMGVGVYILGSFFSSKYLIFQLTFQVLLGITIYIIFYLIFKRENLKNFKMYVSK